MKMKIEGDGHVKKDEDDEKRKSVINCNLYWTKCFLN